MFLKLKFLYAQYKLKKITCFFKLKSESLYLDYRSGNSKEVLEYGIVTIEHSKGDLLLMECFGWLINSINSYLCIL